MNARRRQVLSGLTLGLGALGVATALGTAGPAAAVSDPATDPKANTASGGGDMLGKLRFEVRRDGSKIGTHTLTFHRPADDKLKVVVDIDMKVGFGPITLFRYEHRNETVWQDGRVLTMNTETNDDGDKHFVRARRTDDGKLRVETKSGSRIAPGDIVPTTYWQVETVDQNRLLNTQNGEIAQVDIRSLDADSFYDSFPREGTRGYEIDGDVRARIWYGPEHQWMGLSFDGKGERVTYHPIVEQGMIPTTPRLARAG